MSISQTTPEETTTDQRFCLQCNVALPRRATFCSSCGERLEKKKVASASDEEDINLRYRITTLVRRRSHINLYFALDNRQPLPIGQPRTIAIRDIEIANLPDEKRAKAIALVQQEYDQLRKWQIPHMLVTTDLHIFLDHIFLISSIPLASQEVSPVRSMQRLYTLQDFLQSGQGLPKEDRTLEWVRKLAQAVEELHRREIVLGDLDPYTVALNRNSALAEPRLIISWLYPELQKLLQPRVAIPQISYFSAPEAIQGRPEARSDVYSLGALLYLLLTGNPPDESTLRHRRRLRTPREINSRLSPHVDECVMQALALEPGKRFASVTELLQALGDIHFRQTPRKSQPSPPRAPAASPADAETVRIVPLSQKDMARWRAVRAEKQAKNKTPAQHMQKTPALGIFTLQPKIKRTVQNEQQMPILEWPPSPGATPQLPLPSPEAASSEEPTRENTGTLPITPLPGKENRTLAARVKKAVREHNTLPPLPALPKIDWKDRITGILPVTKPESQTEGTPLPRKETTGRIIPKVSQPCQAPLKPKPGGEESLLKQFQRLVLGQQKHAVEATAIIETPMRIRPDQPYHLRMHIMGRDQAGMFPDSSTIKVVGQGGLSALAHGETIKVEVRSVLQQGYTYILQQATVTIPASGYAAEITIPMQPQPGSGTGRRDRLHIFFLDGERNPLYEKPFIIEVFVSPLVQFGREGYQVLTIPI